MSTAVDALREFIDNGFPDPVTYADRSFPAAGFLQRMLYELPVARLAQPQRTAVLGRLRTGEPPPLLTYHDAAVALVLELVADQPSGRSRVVLPAPRQPAQSGNRH